VESASSARAGRLSPSRLPGLSQHLRRRLEALGPAYASVAVRWLSWVLALGIAAVGAGPAAPRAALPLALALTFGQTLLFTVYAPGLHRPLARVWRRLGLPPVDVRVVWVLSDLLLCHLVLDATGGLHSPFVVYALTAVVFPAMTFRWPGALLAATASAALRLLAASQAPGGLAAARASEQLDGLLAYVANGYIIALFAAYLASLLRRLEAARRRAARAWRETSGLYATAQSVLEGSPDLDALYARVASAVRRHLGLARFGVFVQGPGGWTLRAGYGLPSTRVGSLPGCSEAPLEVGGRPVGLLVGARRLAGAEPETQALLCALAGQLVLGLRNAELMREKAELATVAERARLAREIHDGVAQSLYMLMLNLEAAADFVEKGTPLGARLDQLLSLARRALWEVRHYIFDLKPLLDDAAPLADLLRNPLREFETIARVDTELRVSGIEWALSAAARAAVYRVLQEALANVFKHARATYVQVVLSWQPEALVLEVRDDGCGFDRQAAIGGHGLANLGQRAAEIGGSATVASSPGAGTVVRLEIPNPAVAPPAA
jgi:signal transduction histidine kinase